MISSKRNFNAMGTPAMVTGKSRLVFLLGHPLGHSVSPVFQNAAFRKMGLPWVYVPLDLSHAQVKGAVHLLRAFNVQGANVTVPYKEAVLSHLDGLEPEAKWLGSANTVYRKGSKLWGASTDGEGFLRSLGNWRRKLPKSKGLLIGAGGAAKAVAGALAKEGVGELYIANRSRGRAEGLVKKLRGRYPSLEAAAIPLAQAAGVLSRCDWVVQATSLGLHPGDPAPVSLGGARAGTWAVDMIYHRDTPFLREAKGRRLPCLNGTGMLLHQGALALERWTGKPAPLGVMREALLKSLGIHPKM